MVTEVIGFSLLAVLLLGLNISLLAISNSLKKLKVTKNIPAPPLGIKEFKQGVDHTWNVTQIAIYKLYEEGQLLDYDSLTISIHNSINELTQDNSKLSLWNKKLNSYIQEKTEKQ